MSPENAGPPPKSDSSRRVSPLLIVIVVALLALFWVANNRFKQLANAPASEVYDPVEPPPPPPPDDYVSKDIPDFAITRAEFPNAPGTVWNYVGQGPRRIAVELINTVDIGGKRYVVGLRTLEGSPLYNLYILTEGDTLTEYRSVEDGYINMQYRFPLENGKSWSYVNEVQEADGTISKREYRLTVEACEEIEVGENTYKTLRLRSERVGSDIEGPRYWISPGVGTVRLRLFDQSVMELESFTAP